MTSRLESAGILAESLKRGFSDLLVWSYTGGETYADVAVFGLPVEKVPVESWQDIRHLETCLAECEGHGLLWREDACLLYAARRLGVKPQPYAYSESEHINRLYDAIGG